ncbi:helix-turn-helix transcriptional regulator [Alicyclobacillus sp. TC]|nr:helix-turn-helix transcriptional regulator [Alicyclobacillus sp. TC]
MVGVARLSENVKYYRTVKGMSVRELAMKAGVSSSYIYAIESGARGSNLTKLEKIAEALEVPLQRLWEEKKHP